MEISGGGGVRCYWEVLKTDNSKSNRLQNLYKTFSKYLYLSYYPCLSAYINPHRDVP